MNKFLEVSKRHRKQKYEPLMTLKKYKKDKETQQMKKKNLR